MIGKRILLIIGGGIAAYKIPELVRGLKAEGAQVRCLLTKGGAQFVTPLTLASLSGEKTYEHLFSLTDEIEMGHIRLSREADVIMVAPATADLISKMAQGRADDLASATLLATNKPVIIAPAMNHFMWHHKATQRNLAILKQDGIAGIGPEEGDMACGETGMGRMSEPETLIAVLREFFTTQQTLSGKKALVTAGATREPIDAVRYITNRSSGRQGYAIADALAKRGAETILISGASELSPPPNVAFIQVETAQDMLQAVCETLPSHIAVMTAAVGDWRIAHPPNSKIKKQQGEKPPIFELVENPDILAHLAQSSHRPELLIGFAAETDNVAENARAKLKRKNCDWLLANNVGAQNNIMGGEDNEILFLAGAAEENWPLMPKTEVATLLATRIAEHFTAQPH